MIDRIHHVGVVVHSADDALGFFRDIMGLSVTADRVMDEQGVRGVLLALGENEIELLEPTRDDTGVYRYLESRGQVLHHICFNTDDVAGELARLKSRGVELIDETPREGLAGQIGFIHPSAMHGVLVELAQPPAGAHVSTDKGIDHLATFVSDYEAAKRAWNETIGLEVVNEIRNEERGMVLAQLPSGQAMLEILAGTSPDSPMAKRVEEQGEGAASMVAIEVADIDAEIAGYRAHGITLPDAAPGALPNSVTSTISPDQSFGLAIQLIQFGRSA
jgi:methylmalonyl-CoA/ethylmalonyl-CoA epimerase